MRRPVIQTALRVTLILPLVTFAISKASLAEVVPDGSTGINATTPIEAIANTYEITEEYGTVKGTNLFHSFSTFNVEDQYSANFSGSPAIENIVARVTGSGASNINGNLSSTITGANLYLINPNGIMFGANSVLNISGSFYASTANQLLFDVNQNDVLNMDVGDLNFSSAPIAAFGFTQTNPAGISVTDSTLHVNDGESISLVAGDISLNNGTLNAADGLIQIASIGSPTVVPDDISQLENNNISAMGNIKMFNGSQIKTSGLTSGQIVVRGGTLKLNQASKIMNNVADQIDTANDTVGVDIQVTGDIDLENNSSIQANSDDYAYSGSRGARITANNLSLNNASTIESKLGILAEAINPFVGKLSISAENTLTIKDNSAISTTNDGIGKGANIEIDANEVYISNYGLINSSGLKESEGSAGDISIETNRLNITGDVLARKPETNNVTGIQANGVFYNAPGITGSNSGNISIIQENPSLNVVLKDNGVITSTHYGNGAGGDISIETEEGSIDIENGAAVSIHTLGQGMGGDIHLNANRIKISGAIAGSATQGLTQQRSRIFSASSPRADRSGEIFIDAKEFILSDGAMIYKESRQNTPGSADININASRIDISGYNQSLYDYRTSKEIGETHELAMIGARTQIYSLTGDPAINELANNGGNIRLSGDSINIKDNADISTEIVGASSIAGNITVQANNISIISSSLSSTSNFSGTTSNNPSGNINILSGESIVLLNSTISTKVNSLNGSGGDIIVDSGDLLIDKSVFRTSANLGNGGNIQITSVRSLITPNNIFDASSLLSIDGEIKIETQLDVKNSLTYPEVNFEDNSIRLVNRCNSGADLHSTLTVSDNQLSYLTTNKPTYPFINKEKKFLVKKQNKTPRQYVSQQKEIPCAKENRHLM